MNTGVLCLRHSQANTGKGRRWVNLLVSFLRTYWVLLSFVSFFCPPPPSPPFSFLSIRFYLFFSFPLRFILLFHLSPRPCPSTAGCSPPSMPSIVLCLLLSCFRWFPLSLLCRLAIFCLVVLLISSLSLVATMCSVWSAYCPSFLRYVQPISTFVSVCILQCLLYLSFSRSLSMVSYLVALHFALSSPLLFERFSDSQFFI